MLNLKSYEDQFKFDNLLDIIGGSLPPNHFVSNLLVEYFDIPQCDYFCNKPIYDLAEQLRLPFHAINIRPPPIPTGYFLASLSLQTGADQCFAAFAPTKRQAIVRVTLRAWAGNRRFSHEK